MKLSIPVFFLILFSCSLIAQIPHTISYQGMLTDLNGDPKPDGNYQFTFYLYETSSGGTAIWNEVKSLSVFKGLFSTSLGDVTAFGSNVQFDKPYWLGIKVENEPELSPRIPLTSSSYSLTTENVSVPLNLDGTIDGSNYVFTGYNHGTGHGIQGVSTSGYGTVGISTGTSGETIGVVGNSHSPDGYAILGWNLATTGNSVGVLGRTNSPSGIGVQGFGGTGTNNGIGVYGLAGLNGIGVKGFGGFIGGDFSTGVGSLTIAVRGNSIPEEGSGVGGDFTGGYIGVHGSAEGGAYIGSVYGLWGQASGSAGFRYGVFGIAQGGSSNYAVYASGNLAYTGNLIGPSDIKLKENINSFSDPISILNKIIQLEPKTFNYAAEKFPQMNLPEGTQYGLIAQEVEKVFPELVVDAVHPSLERNGEKSEEVHYKGLMYIELIPILIQAIKEHQQIIENQQKDIDDLKSKISSLMNK